MTEISGSYLNLAEQLSLNENDILFIASDVTQLALQARSDGERFDANLFIESFQKVLNKGTLIIPAYTDHLRDGDTFDYVRSKPTTGALSNKVSRRKDFKRTKDPLHSVFVWGKHQEELLTLDGPSSLGRESIFEWLYQNRAKMICIDVHFQNSLTFVHYVEELREVKYRKPYYWKLKRIFSDYSDEKEVIFYTRQPWVLTDLEELQRSSIEEGVVRKYRLKESEILAFDFEAIYEYISRFLDSGKRMHKVSLVHFAKTVAKKLLSKK